jgi:hypothetical protein
VQCIAEYFSHVKDLGMYCIEIATPLDMFVQLDWFLLRLPQAADIWRGFLYDAASVIELDVPLMQRQTCC